MRIGKKVIFYLVIFVFSAFLFWIGHLVYGGRDAAILMYHSDGEEGAVETDLNVPLEIFQRQMAFLHRHRYNVISLLDYADMLRQKKKIPAKTVVLTFDDGFENNYTKVFPVLKKYHFPATIFVVVDWMGKQENVEGHLFKIMTPEMIKDLSASGLVALGSHTRTHPYLPDINDEEVLRDEIVGSKRALEKILHGPVDAFCYPAGGYTPFVEELAEEAGYKVAVTTLKPDGFAHKDIYALKRIKVSARTNLFVFFIKTSGYYLRMKETSK